MKKLDTILLVEDDETTIFFHKFILDHVNIASKILEARNGVEALQMLAQPEIRRNIDLIFLDVNMPVMNGFEFMEEFEQLPASDRENSRVIILTTSGHIEDKKRAASFPSLSDYLEKPLTEEMVKEIYAKHFSGMAS